MSAGEAVGGESANWGSGAHEHAAAVFGDHETFGTQILDCLANRHSGNAEVVDQRGLGW
ncbi:Uncharacterised protein [Mycobacteroides abscessus subsp. abscessus]|nr:Uncharacterised protein [Mycobacteroides abscessus subsp. abscessus]